MRAQVDWTKTGVVVAIAIGLVTIAVMIIVPIVLGAVSRRRRGKPSAGNEWLLPLLGRDSQRIFAPRPG